MCASPDRSGRRLCLLCSELASQNEWYRMWGAVPLVASGQSPIHSFCCFMGAFWKGSCDLASLMLMEGGGKGHANDGKSTSYFPGMVCGIGLQGQGPPTALWACWRVDTMYCNLESGMNWSSSENKNVLRDQAMGTRWQSCPKIRKLNCRRACAEQSSVNASTRLFAETY